MRLHVCSSRLSLAHVSLFLLSQHHSTALPSPERYGQRYEVGFRPQGKDFSGSACHSGKPCMLIYVKPYANFARGCAPPMRAPTFLLTHPPHNSRSDVGDASYNDDERGK